MSENVPEHETVEGRDLVGENTDSLSAYVGVDPIYQNHADEAGRPYPFSEEEILAGARAAGIPEGEHSHFSALMLFGEDGEPTWTDDADGTEAEAPPAPAKAAGTKAAATPPPPSVGSIPKQAESPENAKGK